MLNFIGIDPSLSQTAVVVINESGKLVISNAINTKLTGPARPGSVISGMKFLNIYLEARMAANLATA